MHCYRIFQHRWRSILHFALMLAWCFEKSLPVCVNIAYSSLLICELQSFCSLPPHKIGLDIAMRLGLTHYVRKYLLVKIRTYSPLQLRCKLYIRRFMPWFVYSKFIYYCFVYFLNLNRVRMFIILLEQYRIKTSTEWKVGRMAATSSFSSVATSRF